MQKSLSKSKSVKNISSIEENSIQIKQIVDLKYNNPHTFKRVNSKMIKDQKKKQRVCSNNILLVEDQQECKKTIYIPCYFRLKVQNIDQLDLESLSGSLKVTMLFTLKVEDLPQFVIQKLKSQITLNFEKEDAIKLSEDSEQIVMKLKKHIVQQSQMNSTASNQVKLTQIQFVIRKIMKFKIISEVFWSPFEIMSLVLSVSIKTITINISAKQTLSVKFNLMDYTNQNQTHIHDTKQSNQSRKRSATFLKLSYNQTLSFGQYNMAEALIDAQYTNDKIYRRRHTKKQIKEQNEIWKKQLSKIRRNLDDVNNKDTTLFEIKPFQNAHFNVPLYKYPNVAISTILIPMLFLALINLAIFFQDNELAGRIGSIGAMMIAFVSLIPTIRAQIPPNRYVIFIQIIVYMQVVTCSLALLDSLIIRNIKNYKFKWYKNFFFLLSLAVNILNLFIILGLVIKYKFISLKQYHHQMTEKQKSLKFDSKKWRNQRCTEYFNLFTKIYNVQVYNQNFLKNQAQKHKKHAKELQVSTKQQQKNYQKAIQKLLKDLKNSKKKIQ